MARKKKGTGDLPGIEGPGVAPVRIAKIDKLLDAYIVEKDKRCAMTPKEVAAKGKLVDAIHENAEKIGRDSDGTIVYRSGDHVVVLKPGKELLSVKDAPALGDEPD